MISKEWRKEAKSLIADDLIPKESVYGQLLTTYEDTVTELEGQLEQVKESLVKIVDNMAETSEDAREMHMEAEWALSQLEKGGEDCD